MTDVTRTDIGGDEMENTETETELSDDDRASCALAGLDPIQDVVPATPPKRLSDLLEMAVDDAMKVAKRPGFKLDMDVWYSRKRATCYVCMAGSLMVDRLGLKSEVSKSLVGEHWFYVMMIINEIRTGYLAPAHYFARAGIPAPPREVTYKILEQIQSTFNGTTSRAPWRVYRQAVKEMREVGL